MRHLLPFLGLALVLTAPAAQAQTPAWTGAAQTVNPAPTNFTRASGRTIATDAAGNAFVGGNMSNDGGSGAPATRAFGSTNITTQGNGSGSGYLAKLSPALQWQWAVRVSDTGEGPLLEKVTVSPAGDLYAAGITNSATSLSVGTLTQTVSTAAMNTLYLTRLNTSGQPQWIAQAPLNSLSSTASFTIRAIGWDAANGNVVVAGSYTGATMTFGTTTLPNTPYGGLFVARLSAAGQWLSATGVAANNAFNTSASVEAYSAAVGPIGQVAFNFRVDRASLALGTAATLTSTSTADRLVAVAQLSPTNVWQWATLPTGTTTSSYYSNGLRYDRAGALWMLGDAGSNALTLGTTTISNGEEFVAKLSATGQWGVVGIIGLSTGSSPGYAQSLAVDGQDNAVIGGQMTTGSTYTFGTQTLAAGTVQRNYTARFGTTGQWQFAQLAPLPTNTAGTAQYSIASTALDPSGNLLATGLLTGNATFGTTALTGSNFGDAYVAKLSNAGLVSAVRQAAGAAPLALYPNPATRTGATLRLTAPAASALPVVLRDAMGRVVGQSAVLAGRQEASVSTAGLAPGLYMLEAGASRAQLVVE